MNLIVDQGNTATKFAIFGDKNKPEIRKIFSKANNVLAQEWLLTHGAKAEHVLISSVRNDTFNYAQQQPLILDHDTPLPISNLYKTPETLGRDRIANAVAAWVKNPNSNSLCIDLGTCIKYDLVNKDGAYLGGNISAGMNLRYKALAHFTDQLPLIKAEVIEYEFGTTTETSIKNGVQHAIFHEINGFIGRYEEQFGELTIFMTGGDLKYFDKGYKNTIFADSDLTIFGLNEILKYNVEL